MKKILISIPLIISTASFASDQKPSPETIADDALLCSLHAVVASNQLEGSQHSDWRDSAFKWLHRATDLGADRNEDPQLVKDAIEQYELIPKSELLGFSVALYKAHNCYAVTNDSNV
ncbi:conserved exported hypothetical protein [Vibrio chagasii]|nr:conserved exported hypothetical protein [Vibrio chagasii]